MFSWYILPTGKYFKNFKITKNGIKKINRKNNAPPVEQKGVLPSDDEEDTLPKVPTKLPCISSQDTGCPLSNIKLDRLKLYRWYIVTLMYMGRPTAGSRARDCERGDPVGITGDPPVLTAEEGRSINWFKTIINIKPNKNFIYRGYCYLNSVRYRKIQA